MFYFGCVSTLTAVHILPHATEQREKIELTVSRGRNPQWENRGEEIEAVRFGPRAKQTPGA